MRYLVWYVGAFFIGNDKSARRANRLFMHGYLSFPCLEILEDTGGNMRLTHYRFVEFLLAGLDLIWGFWLIVFDSYAKSPVLSVLRNWGVPEWLLVVWPVLCGLCIVAMPRHWRRTAHFIAFPFWIFVAFAIFQRDIALTAIPVYTAIGLLHAGSFLLPRDE